MRVTHRLEITALCPADDKRDRYDCEVEVDRVLPVEQIMQEVDRYRDTKIYQEDLAVELARALAAKVRLTGDHFGRVKTVVEA